MIIEIPVSELLQTLTYGYKQFSAAHKAGNTQEVMRLKGWCNALERIVFDYKPEVKSQLLEMRSKIIATDKKDATDNIFDLDIPTCFRKNLRYDKSILRGVNAKKD